MSAALAIARALAAAASREPARWPGTPVPPAPAAPRVLVNLSAGIGDALMALPMIRLLRQRRPASHITLLATPANAALLGPEPGIDAVIPWPATPQPADLLALARRVAALRADLALGTLPSDLVSTAIVLRVAGVPGRLKHRLEGGERARDWQFFFTGLVESRTGAHKVVDNLALLAAAGIDGPEPDADTLAGLMQLQLTEAERGAAAAGWPRQPGRPVRIGMHPGCKPGWEFKRWDPARFADLADRLAGTHGAEILWFGGAEETGLIQGIMARMQHVEAARHVALGIRAAAAVMAGCDAFVSNDSGPMHVATACGIPVVALFNDANPRTQPARTGPFGARHVVVGSSDIQAIEPARVAAAVARVLGRA